MRKKFTSIILSGLLFFPAFAQPADFASAYAAYESGDYRQAYRALKRLARSDNVQAQYLLGLLYINGQGVGQDTEQGLSWLKQSAENGSYSAAAELGQIYITGKGVEMNDREAAKWIELSAALAEEEEAEEECD
ncbi:MAG: tetratricopeptide repeat protein [Pseudomonadota bacterium]